MLALSAKSPKTVKQYLAIQLGTLLGLELTGRWLGFTSEFYRVAYCIATAAVSVAAWRIVRSAGAEFGILIQAGCSALFACMLAITVMQRFTSDDCVNLIAGTVTLFMGTALVLRFRYSKYRTILAPLAVFWCALAASLFGFATEAHRWDVLSYWLTYSLGIVTFCWIGLSGRLHDRPRESGVYRGYPAYHRGGLERSSRNS